MTSSLLRTTSLLLALVCSALVPATRSVAQYYMEAVEVAVQDGNDKENAEEDADGEKLNPQAQVFLKQYRPIYEGQLNAHLHALRDLCNPTREQQEKLLSQTKAVLDESLMTQAKQMGRGNQPQPVGIFLLNGNRVQQPINPWEATQESITKAAKKSLTAEQFAQYEADIAKRKAFRREATATSLVSAIDQQLNLDQQQRDKIQAALLEDWNKAWEGSLRSLMYGATYMPKIPNGVLLPHLNDKQKQIWKSSTKHGRISFSDNGFMGHGNLNIPEFEVRDQQTDPGDMPDNAKTSAPEQEE